MIKYIGPKVKIIRKLGILPGLTKKYLKNRIKTPGQHGIIDNSFNKLLSLSDDYKQRLNEKQKLRFNYCINEKQLLNYYKKAKKKKGSTGIILLSFLESRLDCIVYRLGFAPTILAARQFINHRHILVNNKIVTISSYMCKLNDIISIKNNSKIKLLIISNIEKQQAKQKILQNIINENNLINYNFTNFLPPYLDLNLNTYTGKIISNITCNTLLFKINELKIIEFYSQ